MGVKTTNEPPILSHPGPERRSHTDCRVQALSPENLAGDYAKHKRFRNRGHGNLSPRHAHVHDHGSERALLFRSQSPGRWEESESSGMGESDVEVPAIPPKPSPARNGWGWKEYSSWKPDGASRQHSQSHFSARGLRFRLRVLI